MGPLVMGRCVMGCFVMGRFVMGRFVCESHYHLSGQHDSHIVTAWLKNLA
jgi:hypothetical protein